ncbi:MAG: hypothetical protein ABIO05_07020 [Ferruginibacter sp.]
MLNQTFIGQKGTYVTSKLLGKGGEGTVYDLSNSSSLVLKLYTEKIHADKIRKLELMASIANTQLENYTAWVKDIVLDSNKNVCGFIMKKLENYLPLHILFSPMDRKKFFPDKGYNFLVHVSRNLVTAFHACHEAGLIIGDVNEGNILVNNQGMVAFIDCDSFQIKHGNGFHFCEVGVPRYTSPELLEMSSFNNVVRTINTDSFSMAVLVFQLLFLGRHPFAGKNNSNEDIDEETAIKKKWFAYSIRNKNNKLVPPDSSFNINNLTNGLVDLFHNSFETQENRPEPATYIKEIGIYLKALINCSKSKVHFYPSKLAQCCWCTFQERNNILYFLDDSYLQEAPSSIDIEKFINGFKIEKINLSKLEFPKTYPISLISIPIDKIYIKYKWYYRFTISVPVIVGISLFFISGWFIVLGTIVTAMINNILPWDKKIKDEITRRNEEFTQTKNKLQNAIKEYNSPIELKTYENSSRLIERAIVRFRNIPNELEIKRKTIEENLYNEQLHKFLSTFDIRNYAIPSFGASRKMSLYSAGIRNASEISKLHKIKVQGIGPAFEQILFSWQRQISSKFTYHPDNTLINKQHNLLLAETEQTKRTLESEIKKEYQSLHYIKVNIKSKQEQLKKIIDHTSKEYFQIELDYNAFKKFVA